jgi:hypothetical protein
VDKFESGPLIISEPKVIGNRVFLGVSKQKTMKLFATLHEAEVALAEQPPSRHLCQTNLSIVVEKIAVQKRLGSGKRAGGLDCGK